MFFSLYMVRREEPTGGRVRGIARAERLRRREKHHPSFSTDSRRRRRCLIVMRHQNGYRTRPRVGLRGPDAFDRFGRCLGSFGRLRRLVALSDGLVRCAFGLSWTVINDVGFVGGSVGPTTSARGMDMYIIPSNFASNFNVDSNSVLAA